MIEIYLLEQFVAFAEKGSLLKASLELHLSQPALSRSMKKLEDEFGVLLFDRNRSKLTLNKNGELALEYAKKILSLDREMTEEVVLNDRKNRTVSIGSCAPYPQWKLIGDIQKQYPEWAVDSVITDGCDLVDGLKDKKYQIIVTQKMPEDRSFYTLKYFEERLLVSLPKDHPLAGRDKVYFEELRETEIFIPNNIGMWSRIIESHLPKEKMIFQKPIGLSIEIMYIMNTCTFFISDRSVKLLGVDSNRITVPLENEDAKAEYYISCLASQKSKFGDMMNYSKSVI